MSLLTGNNSIDSLVYSSWNIVAHTPSTLTYSFLTTPPPDASADDRLGFRAMTADQRQAVSAALELWASVANVSFRQVISDGNLQFGTNNQSSSDSSAYAYLPDPAFRSVSMYLDNTSSFNSVFTPGSYGPNVLLHEIGHMLGMKHPGDYDSSGDPIGGAVLPAATDNQDYTVMSYKVAASTRANGKYPVSPMLYDIQAMQYLYGANTSYHAGDDVYKFAANEAPRAIWDAGGINTFDFSSSFQKTTINLNAGAFSETAPNLHNISLAFGVTVQKAIAGSGGSLIIANDLGNTLQGGAGADQFELGKGNDVVDGAGGSDTVVFHNAAAGYGVIRVGDSITVVGEGVDQMQGIETLRFSDRALAASGIAQAALNIGTSSSDVLTALGGSEKVDGGAGIDALVYGAASASYAVRAVPGAVLIQDSSGVSDLLTGVERIQFSDAWFAVDTLGAAGQVYRLYQATFARTPDSEGMGTWLSELDKGKPLEQIVTGFLQSEEFFRVYGRGLSNADYVTLLYKNVLHRAPDAPGFSSHMAELEQGISREHIMVAFSESVELIASLVGVMPDAIPYIPHVG